MRLTNAVAVVVAGLALAGSARAANLIVNGSFEQTSLPISDITALTAYTVGNQTPVGVEVDSHFNPGGLGFPSIVTGWSTQNTGADYNLYFLSGATAKSGDAASRYGSEQQRPNSNFTAVGDTDGGAFMVLDGDPGFSGKFQQTVGGLTAGQTYVLSFDWAAGELSNRTGYSTVTLTGDFGGDAFTTSTFHNTKPSGVAGDFSGWSQVSYQFTAHSTSQVLSFLAVGTAPTSNLPPVAFLDGVSLTAVPEPAAWGLMLLGFGGLGVALRRRRRIVAA